LQNSKVNMKWNIDAQPIFFPLEIRKTYEKIYKKNRLDFGNWIGKISVGHKQNIDWWLTKPTLRNPYNSNLLNYCSVLETLDKLKINKVQIITSSEEMGSIIFNYFNKRFNLEVKIKNNTISYFRRTTGILKSLIFHTFMFLYIKVFIKKKKIELNKNYTLIDTFITPNVKLNRGFYPNLKRIIKDNTFFVPTFTHTFNFPGLINALKNSNNNFLFKEHYLSFFDYIYGYFHFFRRKKFLNKKYIYKKFNISELVCAEINDFSNCNSTVIGILNYRFFKKLELSNLKIRKSINWFENQFKDRGWNLGYRKYFKRYEKNSFGYQNFTRHYNLISFSPSVPESVAKITPNKIIVISKYFKKIAKEFNKKQIVVLGPTNRFENFVSNKIKKLKREKILLILSGIIQIDEALIRIVKKTCDINKKITIFLKDHPILPLDKIIKKSSLPKNLIQTNENLETLLNKCLITIISGPTSVIKESQNMNNIILLPNIEIGTEINAKRLKLNRKYYHIVGSEIEILQTINLIKNKKLKLNKTRNKIIFFENVTSKNIKVFL
tara:strand:+ start:1874 stop:3526 length:1653 start_codon:yes stop_codon:yes gene_type:complete